MKFSRKCPNCNKELKYKSLNKLKFEATKKKLGNKHVILTEDDIEKIDLERLYNMYNNEEIIFDERYVDKFKNYYERMINNDK